MFILLVALQGWKEQQNITNYFNLHEKLFSHDNCNVLYMHAEIMFDDFLVFLYIKMLSLLLQKKLIYFLLLVLYRLIPSIYIHNIHKYVVFKKKCSKKKVPVFSPKT